MDLHSTLEEVFRNTFSDESLKLRDEMSAQDIPGWDSLQHINLMFAIEQAFNVQFIGNEFAELENIGELKGLLRQRALA